MTDQSLSINPWILCDNNTFLESCNFKTSKLGLVCGVKINPFDLYMLVIQNGGFEKVSKGEMWGALAKKMEIPHSNMTGHLTKQYYKKYLCDFEISENLFI